MLSELQGGGGTRVRKNINFPLDLNVVFSWLGIFFFADTSKAFTKLFWSIYYRLFGVYMREQRPGASSPAILLMLYDIK